MGFGACKAKVRRFRRRPKNAPPLDERIIENRQHCTQFYWNAASAVMKTACLTLFLAVEGPRRVVAYATRQPEPKPLFLDCSPWGYRMCACNHHFYDHYSIAESPPPPQPTFVQPESIQKFPSKSPVLPDNPDFAHLDKPQVPAELNEKRRRKWFFFF